jgi:hypothetical protein
VVEQSAGTYRLLVRSPYNTHGWRPVVAAALAWAAGVLEAGAAQAGPSRREAASGVACTVAKSSESQITQWSGALAAEEVP